MVILPRKLFYAIEAVLYVAYNAAQGPVSSKEIAQRQKLPPRYLEQLMQRLVRAGVLHGVRGPRGGYLLARERQRISVADICEVLYEESEEELLHASTPLGRAVVMPLWQSIRSQAMERLRQTSIADLCEQAAIRQVSKNMHRHMDFVT